MSLWWFIRYPDINGLVQDCSNSSALAMELLQSCTKPSTWWTILKKTQLCYWYQCFMKVCQLRNIFFDCMQYKHLELLTPHIDGLVQNYNIPIANALEILQYCTRPLISARNHMSELDWLLIPTANSHRKLKLHAVVNSQHERMDCILAISEKMNLSFLKHHCMLISLVMYGIDFD